MEEKEIQQIEDEVKLREIENNYRLITDSPWGKIRIYRDSARWVSEIALSEYYKERTRLIIEGKYPLAEQLAKVFEERGIWTENDDQEMMDVSDDLRELESKKDKIKDKVKDKKRVEKIDAELEPMYRKFFDLAARKERLFGETVDTMAEVQRRFTLLWAAVRKDENGSRCQDLTPVFDSIDAVKDLEKDEFDYILKKANEFWGGVGVTESFLEGSPEGPTSSSDGE